MTAPGLIVAQSVRRLPPYGRHHVLAILVTPKDAGRFLALRTHVGGDVRAVVAEDPGCTRFLQPQTLAALAGIPAEGHDAFRDDLHDGPEYVLVADRPAPFASPDEHGFRVDAHVAADGVRWTGAQLAMDGHAVAQGPRMPWADVEALYDERFADDGTYWQGGVLHDPLAG